MEVMVIDDQPEVLKQICSVVATASGPDGKPYNVIGLTDHREALRRLENEHFDAVIVDMFMEGGEEDGLEILRTLTGKSPITIVLTAFGSISNCVASMRAGAWDYLQKQEKRAYDRLLESLKKACEERLAHPSAGRANPDSQWAHEHMEELMRDHPGELVAILDRKVVDSDTSYGGLEHRLKARFPVAEPMIVSIPDTTVDTIE
jgi:DNA-binding NtrC family response regulator